MTSTLALMMMATALQAPLGGVLAEIEVAGDPVYTLPHTIVISAETPGIARSRSDLQRRRWVAVRTSERGEERVSSADCPGLRTAALAFGELPPLSPATTRGNVVANADGTLPIGPSIRDGFYTLVKFQISGGASVEVGGNSAYLIWGHETVSALLRCWAPLTPTSSR